MKIGFIGLGNVGGKLAGSLLITFVDGSSVDFDIVKTADPAGFAAAFTQLTGR